MCIDTVVSAPILNEAKWFISYVRTLVNMFQSLTSCSTLIGYFLSCFFWTNLETFQRFYSFLFIFVCVVFSVLQCITWHYPSKFELQRISWKQFGPERSCQADKTFLLSFTLKCSFFFFFFFSTSKIHKAAKLLTCVSGPVWLLHSFMPHYVKTPHCLFKEHWTL